jgi:hypothetical protein
MFHIFSLRYGIFFHIATLVVACVCGTSFASAEEKVEEKAKEKLEESIAGQLLKSAPEILETLRQQDCKTVGVLKFRVNKNGDISDSVGEFNKHIANQLENALLQMILQDPQCPIQMVHDASSVAASTPDANHLSPQGRKALFEAEYPLAWGNQKVHVDRFITGMAYLSADKKSLSIGISEVAPEKNAIRNLRHFEIATNATLLNELGESFQRRGIQEGNDSNSDTSNQQQPEYSFPVEKSKKKFFELQIYYDGHRVDPLPDSSDPNNTTYLIPEPRAGQKVTMTIEQMDRKDKVLGVVLKVNGQNTLYRQTGPDFYCSKWVLDPSWSKTTIQGFQKDDTTTQAFCVATRNESKNLEMDYGDKVGTISLTVFEEAAEDQAEQNPQEANADDETAAQIATVAKGLFPDKPAQNAKELQELFKEPLKPKPYPIQSRGLIISGETIANHVCDKNYRWSSEPIQSIVIRYYKPESNIDPGL